MIDKKKTTVSAPGKLLISGEYSVLEGYEALSCATSRKFYCHTILDKQLSISNHCNKNVPIIINKTKVEILSLKANQFYLVKLILETALKNGLKIPIINIKLDSSELFIQDIDNIKKIGLGSSSALAATLSYQIISNNVKQVKLQDVFYLAYKAHNQYTQGLGSGIDVATAIFGGLIKFKITNSRSLPKITKLKKNEIIKNLICIYTGYSQKTQLFLNAINKFKKKNENIYKNIITKLSIANKNLIKKLIKPKQEINLNFIIAVKTYNNMLYNLGKLVQIDIITNQHKQIAKIAEFYNGTGKASGAGGGDIAIVFLPQKNKKKFINTIKKENFIVINLDMFANGIKIKKLN